MKIEIKSADVPQANDLSKVILTLVAIDKGQASDIQIAAAIGFSQRQGRYYRRAVEIMGFVTNAHNKSVVTEKGKNFLLALRSTQNPMEVIKPYIAEMPIVREIMEHFDSSAPVKPKAFLVALTQLSELKKGDTTAKRRLSTITKWLEQIGILQYTGETKKDRKIALTPYVARHSQPEEKILPLYDHFIESMLGYLSSNTDPDDTSDISNELNLLFNCQSPTALEKIVNESEAAEKVARLILFISENEEISFDMLKREIEELKSLTPSAERLLLERHRVLKGTASTISDGGRNLECMIKSWFEENVEQFEQHYLFDGSSKNCDFYSTRHNFGLESKFSKTSGTKHSAAIKDLAEISKAKIKDRKLLLGVAIGGTGFDQPFWDALKDLKTDNKLDFYITPNELKTIKPKNISKRKFPEKLPDTAVNLGNAFESTWKAETTLDERGLIDSIQWLKKYSKLLFFNFESLLQTWISQTPYAIQCLRLILGWSESKMEGFIKVSVPLASGEWRKDNWGFEAISVLVKSLAVALSESEKESLKTFFGNPYSFSDLVNSRNMGLGGWARKKKDTNNVFAAKLRDSTNLPTTEDSKTITLDDGTKLKSNFTILISKTQSVNVICKYYSTSGSVMSDLAKSVDAICRSSEKDNWILVTDGPGWLSRDKDLRRLLSVAEHSQFRVLNFEMWHALFQSKSLEKHTL